ncbi:MAG: prepilin-type N-terminal cleavage/methylation domain-containing protein [Desulfamplus sp.]
MVILDSKGFTLIEVMIAMAIFAIGILGVAKLQITSTGDNTTSRTMTEGATVAVGELEKSINYAYDKNKDDTDYEADEDDLPEGTTTANIHGEESGVEYTVTRTITDHFPIKDVKKINTVVTWRDKGKNKTFTATTYKAKAE